MNVLLLTDVNADGSLAKATHEALTAAIDVARSLARVLTVGLIGRDVAAAATSIGSSGATRFLGVRGADFDEPRYVTDAAAAHAVCLAAGADIVIAPATSRWLRVFAGVAQRLGGRVDTHVTRIAASPAAVSVTRWYYRQRIEGTTSRSERPWLIAVEPGTHEAWSGRPAPATVEPVAVSLPELRTQVTGVRSPAAGEETIRPDAELLLVAGAGWTKKQADGQTHIADAESVILRFLRSTHASLGGSKSLVDLSGEGQAVLPFMTHLNQIGQTGASPRHRKGLSTCCHGEEPHVVGWRFITERRAINLNPNCGWAQGKADVLYVADAFEVMKKVNEQLI